MSAPADETPNERLITRDIDGSTAERRGFQAVWHKVLPSGGRLSVKIKVAILAFVAIVLILIVIGIASTNPKSAATAGSSDTTIPKAGIVQPRIDDFTRSAKAQSAAAADIPTVDGSAATTAGDGTKLTDQAPAGRHLANEHGTEPPSLSEPEAQTAAPEQTPQQKYDQWLQDQQYKAAEQEITMRQAAIASKLSSNTAAFAPTSQPAAEPSPLAPPSQLSDLAKLAAQAQLARQPGASPTGAQGENKQFLAANGKPDDIYLSTTRESAVGKHEVFAGAIIPAVLMTAIDSDLPGTLTAQVRQTVYDSLNPDVVLIPQGTRIVGKYSADVRYGQTRVLVAWNHLIYPDGSTVAIQGMQGVDAAGQSGFHDLVDNHYLKIFGSATLMSILGVGAQLAQPQNQNALNSPSTGQEAAAALANGLDQAGIQIMQKNLNIQPTLQIRAGYLFNVLVNHTMILPPWRQLEGGLP